MSSYVVNGGNIGNVGGTNNAGNVYVGAGSSSSSQQSSRPGLDVCHVLVIVAKDQEMAVVRDYLGRQQSVKNIGSTLVGGLAATTYLIDEKFRAIIACINGQGVKKVLELVPPLLKQLRPCSVTTVGICGSAPQGYGKPNAQGRFEEDEEITEQHSTRVMIFNAAKLMSSLDNVGQLEHFSCKLANSDLATNLWRNHRGLILRPPRSSAGGFPVLTIPCDECPKESMEVLRQRLVATLCFGQDMEVAAIWKCCQQYDPLQKQLVTLPAFKAISDFGNDVFRKSTEDTALTNATAVLLQFLSELESKHNF
jgi:hypothetical protein